MLSPVLTDVKFVGVGTDLDSYGVAFLAYGITIDNDTGNWLLVNQTWHIPPWTYGWSQPLPGTKAISVQVEAGPSIIPSVNVGTFVRLFITASQVPQSNGYTAVTSASISSTITISGPVTVTGTVGVSGPVDVSGSNVNAAITNTVNITGSVSISGGTVSIGSTVTVTGSVNANITNTVNITGSVSITSGSVTISGSVTVGTITAGNVNVNPGTFTLGGQGDASVGVTGTAFQLSTTSIPTQVVMLKARSGNSGILYVGKSNVTNTQSTAGNRSTTAGLQLDPGDMIVFPATNLNAIYINGTAGDGVSYEYWT